MSELVARIQAAFEQDRTRRYEPVHRASQLPLSYEAITDEWLTDVLCRGHPGAAVTGHELSAPDSGSSNRRRIAVSYNDAGRRAGLPASLFCKASHELSNRLVLGMSGAAHCEVTFYNHVRSLLSIEAPQPYFAALDPQSFNSIVVLKDLSSDALEFCSHRTVMTRARADSQIELLAALHGACYHRPELKAELVRFPTWSEYFQNTCAFGMEEGSNQGFRAAEEVIPPRLYRRYAEIWPATVASVERHDRLPATLAHGDVHLKNWYVAGDGRMGLSDWQCASRGHWGRDVAYALSTALTVEDRRAWERDLLGYYIDRLQAAGGPALAFDEAWGHYRQQMMSALTWWTITLAPAPGMPDMQPRDITVEFIRRIATAIDDLDSLDCRA
jgi:hypothetical protein